MARKRIPLVAPAMTHPDSDRDAASPPPRYRPVRLLRQGGFSRTYMARDPEERLVVVKEYFPPLLAERAEDGSVLPRPGHEARFDRHRSQFRREAAALRRLDHPNILAVLDRFDAAGTSFLVTEVVTGRPLDRLVSDPDLRLPPERVTAIALRLLSALGAVHAAGMLHGDVKPANVILDGTEQPILIDFGTVRSLRRAGDRAAPAVTDGYSAPELYRRDAAPGPQADLYSAAATLWSVITGRVPAPATDRAAALKAGGADPLSPCPDALKDYPAAFRKTLAAALSLDPGARPGDAASWARDIGGTA